MRPTIIKLPYSRPASLTDPYSDHTAEYLAQLVAKSDEDLQWYDFQNILGPHLPAGTYEESAYFLPLAFDFILSHDEHALDLVTPLIGFVSKYAGHLSTDGALTAVRQRLTDSLEHWSNSFRVVAVVADLSQSDSAPGQSYVQHSETIIEAINDLVSFSRHQDLAEAFVNNLAETEAIPVKSAWFLELVRTHLMERVRRITKKFGATHLFDDQQLSVKHIDVVCNSSLVQKNPDYWQEMFWLLGRQ